LIGLIGRLRELTLSVAHFREIPLYGTRTNIHLLIPVLLAHVLLVLSSSATALAQDAAGRPWPFGEDPAAAGATRLRRLDLYNLGLLGAKARDADAPLREEVTSGRRAVASTGDRGHDRGPDRLAIEILFPDGPAEKAGLRPGDVIIGMGRRPFGREGSLAALAQALVKAETSSKGVISLTVQRGKERRVIDVTIPTGTKEMAKPTSIGARIAVAAAAGRWLASRQEDDGAFKATLSGNNGVICQTSVAGLAWLTAGGTTRDGPFSQNIDTASMYVMRHVGDSDSAMGPKWDQSTWAYAHAGIFLGELHARDPSALLQRELHKIAAALQERQEVSGGYGHGPGGPNALGYVELNIQAALVLNALGLAKRAGFQVDAKVVERATTYIEKSSSGDGGVGYSTSDGQRGSGNIGRTAGAYLGFVNLGLARHPFTSKMGSWIKRHADESLDGHASLMQHVLLGGLGAQVMGGETAKSFWSSVERDLVLARSPDGSLQPRPWHESLRMGSNSDVSFGEVWTTAAWAIVLGAAPPKGLEPLGLPALLGKGAGR
jgi:hypothetical protein